MTLPPGSESAPDPVRERASQLDAAITVTCWGTRGSIPAPGPETVEFGGNTPCLEVRAGGQLLIFDAGTGIRGLGRWLARSEAAVSADLFLTHFHWDHIQGFPFFEALYRADSFVRVHAPAPSATELQARLLQPMSSVYFPVPAEALVARLEFAPLDDEPCRKDDLEVAAFPVRHPQGACGYRVRRGDSAIAYVPDNELFGGEYPVPEGWYGRLIEFLRDVDLLFHDAMYTDAEYASREGWGHSTFAQALQLAEDAGVRRLCFFHHAPERTDAELLALLRDARADLGRRGSSLQVDMAAECVALAVPPSRAAEP